MQPVSPHQAPFDFRQPWAESHALSELDALWAEPADDTPTTDLDEVGVEALFAPMPVVTSIPPWLAQTTLPLPERARGPSAWLETPSGNRVIGSSFARGRITLGRSPSSHVVLTDPSCSREHAEIRLQGGVPMLTDGGSKNGVAVNGERVWCVPLTDGDLISLGGLRFRWCQGRARRRDEHTQEIPSVI